MRVLLLVLALAACGKDESETKADQGYEDYSKAHSLALAAQSLYNANIAGKVSVYETKFDCPISGSGRAYNQADATGTSSTLNYDFQVSNCVISSDQLRITLDGSFKISGNTNAEMSVRADEGNLRYSGFVQTNVRVDFDESCAFGIRVPNEGKLSGVLCGRDFKEP